MCGQPKVHGSKDFFPISQAVRMLEGWADLNGCSSTQMARSATPTFGGVWENTTVVTDEYSAAGCTDGGSVTLWRLEGAPHFPFFSARHM